MSSSARFEQKLARQRSGYPEKGRHEVQSVAMLEQCSGWLAECAHDADLVLYLVGSHHGYCRPFAPVFSDAAPTLVSLAAHSSEHFGEMSFRPTSSDHGMYKLDSPLADRFWRLVARYGWLELCRLEAILRLADHRASEEEQQRSESA
jgi:CRISPR-associated endonuclease/helicase Cas3